MSAPSQSRAIRPCAFALFWAVCVVALGIATLAGRDLASSPGRSWAAASVSAIRTVPFANWDGRWYVRIAAVGYEWKDDGQLHSAGFFPLYPIAIAAASRVTSLPPGFSGQLVSLGCLLFAVVLLSRLANEEGFDGLSTIQALLFFPASFFFVCVYSESLFLLCTAGFILGLRRGRPLTAALWGFLAALTRPSGIVLVVPALLVGWEAATGRARLGLWEYAAAAAGSCARPSAF